MAASPLQVAFNAGELSRRLRGRVDSPIYGRGLDYDENFEPLPQGPLLMRGPFEFIDKLAAELGVAPRIIPFRLAGRQDAIIALGDLGMLIYKADGGKVTQMGAERCTGDGKPPWADVDGTVDYDAGTRVYTLQPGAAPERMRRSFAANEAGQHRVTLEYASIAGTPITFNLHIGTTPGGTDLLDSGNWSDSADFSPYTFTINVPAPGTIYIDFGLQSTVSEGLNARVRNFSVRRTASSMPVPAPWSAARVPAVQYASETGKDRMILVHGNVVPQVLTCNDFDTNDWTLVPITDPSLSLTDKPAEWTGTNWPSVIEIHKGRTWWSGTPTERNKLWASKVGAPFDFSVSSPTVASDRIIETLQTKGAIKWFKGQKVLLCGTDEGEHAFTSQSGAISPLDIHADEESAFGCGAIMAVRAGNKVLYVSNDRRKVRAIGFDAAETNGWVSKDLTFIAEHITEGLIDDIHFAKDPHNTIICRVGGELRLCTFDEGEQVLAWWRVSTDGDIISTCASNGPDGSCVWAAVQRTNGIMLERMWMPEKGTRITLDSLKTGTIAVGGDVTGLDHLEGETVRVVVEGVLLDDAEVTGGEINIADVDLEGKLAYVGLKLPLVRGRTLPKNVRGGKVRSPKVGIMVDNSALPLINGRRPPERDPGLAWDDATGLATGKFEVAGNLGWDGEGMVTIEQDLPFRTEILAIFEVTQANDL